MDESPNLPPPAERRGVASSDPVGYEPGRRVLLVDDSRFFRALLKPALERAGYEVRAFASAADALAATADAAAFDVVVSDLDMPGMDGAAFALALRGDERHAAVPIIALGADPAGAPSPPFTARITKFDREGLLALIREKTAA